MPAVKQKCVCMLTLYVFTFLFLFFVSSFSSFVFLPNKNICAETRSGNDVNDDVVILSC